MIRTDMFGYLRVDAGWLWKPKRLLIHTAPTAAVGDGGLGWRTMYLAIEDSEILMPSLSSSL